MDVCVVGAGIGGLALANGLVADGHAVQVLERSSGPSVDGAAVTIYSNGAAALDQLGVALGTIGAPLDRLVIRGSSGRRLLTFDLGLLADRTGYGVRSVPRLDLIDALSAALDPGVVRYGASVTSVRVDGSAVSAALEAGEPITPQLLVGADGYRSVVRRSNLSAEPARDVGWATWQGLSPVLPDLAAGSAGLLMVGPAGLVGMLPAGQGRTQWWFDTRWVRAEPAAPSPLEWLRHEFAGYAEPVPSLLAAVAAGDIGLYPHVLHEVPEQWGSGPVTLLGDAAHAFPPSQAQGANQALEDAWLLRRTLRTDGDIAELLRRYERRRTPRVRVVSRMAASERTNRAPSALLARLSQLTPTAVASRGYLRLIGRFSSVLNADRA